MKKDKNEKSPVNLGSILIRLAAVLFCLLMVSIYLMSGLFARYVSRDQGTDSARVAKWDVAAMLSPAPVGEKTFSQVDVVCQKKTDGTEIENQGIFELTLTNKSEVAVQCAVAVKLYQPLPKGVTAVLRNPAGQEIIPTESEGGEKLTYDLKAGSGSAKYDLVFTVDWKVIDFAVHNTDGKFDEETITLDFDVDVSIDQID